MVDTILFLAMFTGASVWMFLAWRIHVKREQELDQQLNEIYRQQRERIERGEFDETDLYN